MSEIWYFLKFQYDKLMVGISNPLKIKKHMLRYSFKIELHYIFFLLSCYILFLSNVVYTQENNNNAVIDSLIEKGNILQNKGDFTHSDSLLYIAYEAAKKSDDKVKQINILNKLAINATLTGRLSKAVILFEQAIDLCKKQGSMKLLSDLYENISLTYQDMGDLKKSIDAQFLSLKIRQENNIPKRIASNYKKISSLYDELGDYNKQEEYIRKALSIVTKDSLTDKRALIAIYNTIGNFFDNKSQYDSSAYYYKLVISEGKKIAWDRAVSTGVGNLANILKKQGKYDKALKTHLTAVKLESEVANTMGVCMEYLMISEIYGIKKQYRQAIKWASKAYQLAEEKHYIKKAMAAAEQLGAMYAKLGDYKQAFNYLRTSKTIRDSVRENEDKQYLAEIEAKYQNELKVKEIELLRAQNIIATSRLKYTIIFIILAVAIALLSFRYYRRQNIFRTNNLKLQALSAQMNPHFIFNVLGAIQAYMYKNDAEKSAYFLERFAKLSRAMLNSVEKKSVSLEEELENIKIYIELEQFRYDNSFTYKIDCKVDDAAFVMIPPMILQPFVENAVKHGLVNKEKDAHLRIVIEEKCNEITVVIEDNGPGFKTSENKTHKSKSLGILEKRRLIMQKQLKKPLRCKIENIADIRPGESGVKITVSLPIMDK